MQTTITQPAGSPSRGIRQKISGAGVAFLLAISSLLVPQFAAHAATVTDTIDGVTYTADDANVAAGATATAYTPGSLNVTIPSTVTISGTTYDVTKIDDEAFRNKGLTGVTIPTTVTSIGANAFRQNALTTVVIPDSVTSIGANVFAENSLTSVTLSAGLTEIANGAFAQNNLTTIDLPGSLTAIGETAFEGNQLVDVIIPTGVTTIGQHAFGLNSTLATVTLLSATAPTLTGVECTFGGTAPGPNATPTLYYAPGATGYDANWNKCGYPLQQMRSSGPTVTFDSDGGSAVAAQQLAASGNVAVKPADPTKAGYDFVGWYIMGPVGVLIPYDFATQVTSNITLVAVWAPNQKPVTQPKKSAQVQALAKTGTPDDGSGAMLFGGAFALLALGTVTVLAARRRTRTV